MNQITLDSSALQSAANLFAFAEFTKHSETLIDDCNDAVALMRYRKAWFELEIINSVALEEWESDGRPSAWDTKWNEKYRKDAHEVIQQLLNVAKAL